jgi:hypothetical protein
MQTLRVPMRESVQGTARTEIRKDLYPIVNQVFYLGAAREIKRLPATAEARYEGSRQPLMQSSNLLVAPRQQ